MVQPEEWIVYGEIVSSEPFQQVAENKIKIEKFQQNLQGLPKNQSPIAVARGSENEEKN